MPRRLTGIPSDCRRPAAMWASVGWKNRSMVTRRLRSLSAVTCHQNSARGAPTTCCETAAFAYSFEAATTCTFRSKRCSCPPSINIPATSGASPRHSSDFEERQQEVRRHGSNRLHRIALQNPDSATCLPCRRNEGVLHADQAQSKSETEQSEIGCVRVGSIKCMTAPTATTRP